MAVLTRIGYVLLLFLAHQHKACRPVKIKQETTAVGDYSVAVNVLRKKTALLMDVKISLRLQSL